MGWPTMMSLPVMWTVQWIIRMKQKNRDHALQLQQVQKHLARANTAEKHLPRANTAKKRKLAKLEKADRTTAYMFETMIEANRKAEEREEKESEE